MNIDEDDFLPDFLSKLQANPKFLEVYPNRGDLVRFLTNKIYFVKDIVEIILLAGFSPGYINLQGSAMNVWGDTIHYADKSGRLVKLIEAVIQYQTSKKTD